MSEDILQSTMGGLDAGLDVLHIATLDPQCCALSRTVEAVRADERFRGFDHVPVVNEAGRVVGVFAPGDAAPGDAAHGAVGEAMRPLDDTMLVSAAEPLARFLPTLADGPYRPVVRGTRVGGIVTRSDVLKLPVRMLAFTLVTHLEMVMARLIQHKYPHDGEWLGKLSKGCREKIEDKFAKLRRSKLDVSWLESADFCDKRDLVAKLYKMGKLFVDDLKDIEDLRNTVAHAGSYGANQEALLDFLRVLGRTQHWIAELTNRLDVAQEEDA